MSRTAVERSDASCFFQELAAAKHRVLLLDYDGTIAPFHHDRRRAIPYRPVPQLLEQIMADCGTRLILLSGRSADEIPALLGLNRTPEIWGMHGLERRHPDGRLEEIDVSADALEILALAETQLESENLAELLEIKVAGVAVHWRAQSPSEILRIRTQAYNILQPLAAHPELLLSDFDEGVELRLRSANKGAAVSTILGGLDPGTAVAYLGDDTTDEDAFRALNGKGLTVLVRPKHRFTAAQLWLRPPDELVQFLHQWIRASQGDA